MRFSAKLKSDNMKVVFAGYVKNIYRESDSFPKIFVLFYVLTLFLYYHFYY